ncbi:MULTISPECIES: O-linked N-acetylglucosamine transferase, SPINDLY family protein [unclassified Coleofasciculus]|uniref:O-linked N-acetylglucosamine transferase, SPINDLY family protein n=1 Tax=unclassified Coleofasciculus TaxID=2692782 RepID=UPI0018809226|nr:O-linked N-acetylglucosamine transferase, SPINDLY family protein [Coleofasciculus sp. LEGE 07092]MBE9125456.1 O-linked N-acetylglucosamine transferase, SPINDLY family protein [Coleofasciculus sp. LEGE 07081]MBE9147142.1 O-linked N-acetylglucosamine transferase, SPINDLY family protein [Coleofasciculus sp. LEGE 07092]
MSAEFSSTDLVNWQQQAYQYLIQENYSRAAKLYEQAIELEPSVKSSYWYLGLIWLLQGQEAETQTTWLVGMAEGEPEQVDQWTKELIQVLDTEAERQEALSNYSVAWLIRQHLRELSPSDIDNLLQIIQLSIRLERFSGEDLTSLGIIDLLQSEEDVQVNPDLLLKVLQNLLDSAPTELSFLEFAEACLPYMGESQAFINMVLPASIKIAYSQKYPTLAAQLAELCLRLDGEHREILRHLASFYQNSGQYDESIKTAKFCYSLMQTLPDKIFALHLILRGLMSAGGLGQEAYSLLQQQESLLLALIEKQPLELEQITTLRLSTPTFFLPYYRDDLKRNRWIQNQVSWICQSSIQHYAKEQAEQYRQKCQLSSMKGTTDNPLKIGYLSHCLGRHSVGWLARWLFEYHDHDRFQIHGYFVNYRQIDDFLQDWYVEQVFQAHKLGMDGREIAERIYQDEIDILIDLDSITLDISYEVMALKSAPVQVTWLGWDASGLPSIDYFMADPYVLPDSAQAYYSEQIWRLPQTYIAVDGFEVGVPTLRREQLDIPTDAVVYLSSQGGYKRHRHTAQLQLKILKAVPNSYFLIKGFVVQEAIKKFFIEIAEEEGVDCNRLKFLPSVALEATHRANLGIADVVLDTYPYNGATTTLETLWIGIPLVTRVGEQFAARNTYTMMINAGITEGIAWTDEEYVEWGIRLGKDEALRQQVVWKLRQSRQTAPLWNAKQFTREMESAYQQMWQRYIDAS